MTKVLSIQESDSVELVTRCDNCVDRVCEAVRQKRRELSEAGIQLLLLLPPSLSDAPSLHHPGISGMDQKLDCKTCIVENTQIATPFLSGLGEHFTKAIKKILFCSTA